MLAGLLLTACSTSPLPRHPRPALPSVRSAAITRYALPAAEVTVEPVAEPTRSGGVRTSRVTLVCGSERAEAVVVEPDDDLPRPLVLCLPILAGKHTVAALLAAHFAASGIRAAWVSRAGSTLEPGVDVAGMEALLRRTVVHSRMFLAWARTRPDVDPQRLAVFGTSLGGMVGCAVLAAEPELAAGILAITGGDLPDLLLNSRERRVRRWRGEALDARAVPASEVRRHGIRALDSDPLSLAAAVDPGHLLVFATRFDDSVPGRNQDLLWEALGRPQRHLLPAGHYGVAVFLPWILARADRFLAARFATAGSFSATDP